VIARGTHAELLSRRGHYTARYRQFVEVDEAGGPGGGPGRAGFSL
jgi:hypothetical protein